MPHTVSFALRCAAALLLAAGATKAAPVPAPAAPPAPQVASALPAQEKQEEPSRCCFTNQRYSGTCEVTPTAQETCASILDYLNSPMSQGKGYCGNTEIRGGWQGGACEVK